MQEPVVRAQDGYRFLTLPLLGCIVLLSLLVTAYGAYHRIPWSDEGWFSSASDNLAHHGHMGTTVIEPTTLGLTRVQEHTYWIMPLFPLGQGLWYMVFPNTVLGTRAFSMLWMPVMLYAFWVLLSGLFARREIAWLGVALLATSFVFMDNGGFGRPELMCAALGIAGLAAYVSLRKRSLIQAMLAANALIAASGLSHPNGVYHLAGLCLLILWLDGKNLNWRVFMAGAVPYAVFGAIWGIYISQDPVAFLDQMRGNSADGRWPKNWSPIALIWAEIHERYLVGFGFSTRGMALLKAFSLFAYVASLALCLGVPTLRRHPGVRILLGLLTVYFISMSVFNQKLTYYLIHIVPVWISLLAVVGCWLWDRFPGWRTATTLGLVGLMVLECGGIAAKAYTRSYVATQRELVRYVRENSGPQDRIFGSASLIYEFGFDSRLLDDPSLGLKTGNVPDVIVVETLYRLLYEAWQQKQPADYERIQQLLGSYRLGKRIGDYEVYFRRKGEHP